MKRSFPIAILALLASFILASCNAKQTDKYADSPFLGSWSFQYPVIDNGVDYSAGFWEAHDALSYEFNPDGTLIISGGPQPLDPEEYTFEFKDWTLTITSDKNKGYIEQYKVLAISPDSIRLCDIQDSISRGVNDYSFVLVKH